MRSTSDPMHIPEGWKQAGRKLLIRGSSYISNEFSDEGHVYFLFVQTIMIMIDRA